jgi:hypothetical protein
VDKGKGDATDFGCVTAVKALTGAPGTAQWRRGKKVVGNNVIMPLTAIATFGSQHKSGHFEFKGHAAIFVRHAGDGIVVYDQWWDTDVEKLKRFSERTIPYKCAGYISNDAAAFYVIELTEFPSGNPMFCGKTSHA